LDPLLNHRILSRHLSGGGGLNCYVRVVSFIGALGHFKRAIDDLLQLVPGREPSAEIGNCSQEKQQDRGCNGKLDHAGAPLRAN
jgi:hypothetical protein